MSAIQVESENLEKAQQLLAGIDGGFDRAVKSAMARTVAHLRTNTSRAIREKYDISKANIRANENVRVSYRYGNGVTAFVTFAGQKIPLYRYGGTTPKMPIVNGSAWTSAMIAGFWKRVHPSMAAAGHQLKDTSPYRFDDAFTARMKSGHIGIFERSGGSTSTGSDAIHELMGSSVPQMLGNEDVQEDLAQATMDKFDERMEVEINRILNGWGGR